MHVLITADTVGGVWTYTQDLVTELANRGFRITLVSFGVMPTAEQAGWLRDLRQVKYLPTSFRLEWMPGAAEDVERSHRFLESVIREVRPDVLHTNQFSYGALNAGIPRVVVAHSDVVSWWQAVHGADPPGDEWSWYRSEVERGLRGADLVIAPSEWMSSRLYANYRFCTPSQVIYNGRNPSLFEGSKTKEKFALSVGRVWDKGKQLYLLFNQDLGWPVYIVGTADEPGNHARDNQNRRQNSPARAIGPVSQTNLSDLYSRAAIYVATSRYEPFGLALVEAALSGCALVANDIPVFHELWDDCAMYFATNDAGALSRTVTELAKENTLRQDFADRAQQRARNRFTAARMTDAYCDAYERVSAREQVA